MRERPSRWFETHPASVLALALTAQCCTPAYTSTEPANPAPAAAATPRAPAPSSVPAPVAGGTPWRSDVLTTQVPELRGKPLTLQPGEHCKTFRNLPSLSYATNTLVEDACLRIPNDTVIEVRDGVTLAIVATSGLYVGKNVTFDAKGTRGRRGNRAAFASISYSPATDAEIQALCVDHGNRCACPNDESSLATIRGQAGAGGSPGGTVRVIAGELFSPSKLAGFGLDVSGGSGGPPGDSGTLDCARGQLRCSSAVCSAGALSGPAGQPGGFFAALGGTVAVAAMERMAAALGPANSGNAVVAGPGTDLSPEAARLDAEAIQKGWQRSAGDVPY